MLGAEALAPMHARDSAAWTAHEAAFFAVRAVHLEVKAALRGDGAAAPAARDLLVALYIYIV